MDRWLTNLKMLRQIAAAINDAHHFDSGIVESVDDEPTLMPAVKPIFRTDRMLVSGSIIVRILVDKASNLEIVLYSRLWPSGADRDLK